ncbi:MAG: hypothetical protein Q4F21_15070 [Lachnospiraceae bacterium]|nr:hypothetical protein [Lachnospiraceae bacterium]
MYYNFHEYFPACDEVNHNSGLFYFPMPIQGYDIFPYLEEKPGKTLAGTEKFVPEKMVLLLERYQGKSIALPVITGVDDSMK